MLEHTSSSDSRNLNFIESPQADNSSKSSTNNVMVPLGDDTLIIDTKAIIKKIKSLVQSPLMLNLDDDIDLSKLIGSPEQRLFNDIEKCYGQKLHRAVLILVRALFESIVDQLCLENLIKIIKIGDGEPHPRMLSKKIDDLKQRKIVTDDLLLTLLIKNLADEAAHRTNNYWLTEQPNLTQSNLIIAALLMFIKNNAENIKKSYEQQSASQSGSDAS